MRVLLLLFLPQCVVPFVQRAPMVMSSLRDRPKKDMALVPIGIGDPMPAVDVERVGSPGAVSTLELFGPGCGRCVLFGLPGAFTPTCSDIHLPGFARAAEKFKEAGVDVIACTTENDKFVLSAWNASVSACTGIDDLNVVFLADADGDLAQTLGLREDMGFGMGLRTQRFALVINDGIIEHLAIDPGMDICNTTSADAIFNVVSPPVVEKKTALTAPNNNLLIAFTTTLLAAAAAYYVLQQQQQGSPMTLPTISLPPF